MELTRSEIFSAMNDKHLNIKEIDGEIILPVAYHAHEYTGSDGKIHNVLVIKDGISGVMYRTEVRAFIEKFMSYIESFGDLPDEEKPRIKIACRISKQNNKYVNFDLAN